MHPIPREQWAHSCVELSRTLQGRRASVEVVPAEGELELVAANTLFEGMRVEFDSYTVRLLVVTGGRALLVAENPVQISRGEGDTIVIEMQSGAVARVIFAPAMHAAERPRLGLSGRERAVGGASH